MSARRVDKIRDLIAVATIGDVRLVETSAKVRFHQTDAVPDGAEVQVKQAVQLKDPAREDGSFFVLAAVEVVVSDKNHPGGDPLLSVQATFELEYRVPEGFKASREQLQTFAELNGSFNAWPYMREFVQSVTTRMRVPPIILPLYRMPKSGGRKRISRRDATLANRRELAEGGKATH